MEQIGVKFLYPSGVAIVSANTHDGPLVGSMSQLNGLGSTTTKCIFGDEI